MATSDPRIELEAYIEVLKKQLKGQVSPDAKATALAAIVQAKALMLMSDNLQSAVRTLVYDGMRPLMTRLPSL